MKTKKRSIIRCGTLNPTALFYFIGHETRSRSGTRLESCGASGTWLSGRILGFVQCRFLFELESKFVRKIGAEEAALRIEGANFLLRSSSVNGVASCSPCLTISFAGQVMWLGSVKPDRKSLRASLAFMPFNWPPRGKVQAPQIQKWPLWKGDVIWQSIFWYRSPLWLGIPTYSLPYMKEWWTAAANGSWLILMSLVLNLCKKGVYLIPSRWLIANCYKCM